MTNHSLLITDDYFLQAVNHAVLVAVLAVAPPALEVAAGVHGAARQERKLCFWTGRRLVGVLLVYLLLTT